MFVFSLKKKKTVLRVCVIKVLFDLNQRTACR